MLIALKMCVDAPLGFILVIPADKFKQSAAISAASLTLLNEKALNALLSVPIFDVQKLINKNEVIPISSQPSNKVNHEPARTNNVIDHAKSLKKTRKFMMLFSCLIYENAYK